MDLDPQAIFVRVVTSHLDALELSERMAASADNTAAAIGAVRTQIAAGQAAVSALALVGLIPDPTAVLLARARSGRSRSELRELVRG